MVWVSSVKYLGLTLDSKLMNETIYIRLDNGFKNFDINNDESKTPTYIKRLIYGIIIVCLKLRIKIKISSKKSKTGPPSISYRLLVPFPR